MRRFLLAITVAIALLSSVTVSAEARPWRGRAYGYGYRGYYYPGYNYAYPGYSSYYYPGYYYPGYTPYVGVGVGWR